ncbi:MAG: arginine--tRNA ligase [Alphaproteobacteria bacterium]|nr:arginine--tRNA ligase [Alphaproteobacteria bacterium]
MTPIPDLLTGLLQQAASAAGLDPAAIAPVVPTRDPSHGEYQSNSAFKLAKAARKAPRDVAALLAEHLPDHPAIGRTEVAGPGFLNLWLGDAWLGERLAAQCDAPRFGVPAREGCVVIDYSSPNVAKRMHVGHMRSTIIGEALARLHRFVGYEVIADNHLGDWGTQFGKLIVAWHRWLDPDAFRADAIGELQRIYVRFHEAAKDDPALDDLARAETAKLQSGDPENLALWSQFIDVSMIEFNTIYERLDVSFDVVYGESHYNERLQSLVDELLAAGVAADSEGAVVVPFEKADGKGLADTALVIRKSDGAALYGTTDLATIEERIQTWDPVRILYVTAHPQQLHFRQVFAAARKAGWTKPELEHVWFGMLTLPEGKLASREGRVITLKDLLDEAHRRARVLVDEKSPHLPEDERDEIAEAVGVGAVRYADLSQNPQSNIVFDWDKMISLDGNTAPFLMYSYARCRNIQSKGEIQDRSLVAFTPSHPLERELAVALLGFPEVVELALGTYRANLLCDYLFGVAKALNRFYGDCPVLRSEGETLATRLALVEASARVLGAGMQLLGIRPLDRM